MNLARRKFLGFLGLGIATTACGSLIKNNTIAKAEKSIPNYINSYFGDFQPVKYPIPLEIDQISADKQKQLWQTYQVEDDLILPDGYSYQVIASWGDVVGDSRFGYNNDYVSYVETAPSTGYLTVNFEYISARPWLQTYEEVIKKPLSTKVLSKLQEQPKINFNELDADLQAEFRAFFAELLIDQGIGIISVRQDQDGKWARTYSKEDRRITGLSGWQDDRYLTATGGALTIFQKTSGLGYIDGLGAKIIGTFGNCAGGTTPWGTVFSAEENYQSQVPEAVMADGTSFAPGMINNLNGQGNVFGLAGNKYGWMVEVDPSNANDYGKKHTWLGRYRHEAVGIRAVANQPLAFYSGCDRMGGHVYKFVSAGKVINPQDKANSQLLEQGMLYVAKFNADGSGKWLPLAPSTPVNPDSLSHIYGGMTPLPNPEREKGGFVAVNEPEKVDDFRRQFATLKDLYRGDNEAEIQGAILIDAHFAGNAIGATCCARPEDTIIQPTTGHLFIAFTAGGAGSAGGCDTRIFADKEGKVYNHGCLMRLEEKDNLPSAMEFTWEIMALGGEPATGGLGFAQPDNLEFDNQGNLWMVTDMPTGLQDRFSRADDFITPIFGNNALWYIPLEGEGAGLAYPFAIAPMETEATGLFFTPDNQTLFLAIQHPGEKNGMRMAEKTENKEFSLLTTTGEEFKQNRTIPIGSNWPNSGLNQPPKPSLVAISKG